jgi:uncharacterized membrane protein YcaP (DUF421 family)
MEYTSIFDPIPWEAIGHTVIQTFTLYWLLLIGLKLVGRRVFGEMGPQDLIILLLIAEACDLGLANEKAGYWGTIASVLTILVVGGIIERVPFIRKFLEDNAVVLFKDGQLDKRQMRKNLVEEEELEKVAREYGLNSYQDFSTLVLEGDGSITGVIKPEVRELHKKEAQGVAG